VAFLVERVEIKEDLLIYRGEGRELHEGQLDDEQSVSQADDRLVGGRTDPVAQFDLRLEGLRRRAEARRSPTARLVVLPQLGHATILQPCTQPAVTRFFAGRPLGHPCAHHRAPKRLPT
jgi:GAF domain-containing protein